MNFSHFGLFHEWILESKDRLHCITSMLSALTLPGLLHYVVAFITGLLSNKSFFHQHIKVPLGFRPCSSRYLLLSSTQKCSLTEQPLRLLELKSYFWHHKVFTTTALSCKNELERESLQQLCTASKRMSPQTADASSDSPSYTAAATCDS